MLRKISIVLFIFFLAVCGSDKPESKEFGTVALV